jgi:hypothetical protein
MNLPLPVSSKPIFSAMALVVAAFGFGGCANITFYADKNLTQPTGIKLHLPKPYLLITKPADPEKPATAQIVSLPDPDEESGVIYAKRTGFVGSTDLSVTWTNGAVSTLGAKADPKADAFLTALVGAAKALEAAKDEPPAAKDGPGFDLYAIEQKAGELILIKVKIPNSTK